MSLSRTGSIRIDEDEYKAIRKGQIRKNLARYLGSGRIKFRSKDGGIVSITVDSIEIPSWRYGFPTDGGIGQGEGRPGKDLGPAPADDGEGEKGEGGEGHGASTETIDLTEDEFVELLQEVLELPRIQPKGDRTIIEEHEKYSTVARKGPRSMVHSRRSLIEALKRSIAEGLYAPPQKTVLIPRRKDLWFKSWETVREPKNNAVIFFKRDVSGSMGPEERRVVSFLCDLCEFWLRKNYNTLETVYIIHDDHAEEVTRERFFHEDWGGGTTCSSALVMMHKIIEERFPPESWNIYAVYLSDGFNFGDDNDVFIKILGERTLPIVNQYNYGQIDFERPWWLSYKISGADIFSQPGTLGALIQKHYGNTENVAFAGLKTGDHNSAVEALKRFFKSGN